MRLTLILGTREADALVRLALREDRPLRDQALRMLIGSLIRSGDLNPEAQAHPLTSSEGGDSPPA